MLPQTVAQRLLPFSLNDDKDVAVIANVFKISTYLVEITVCSILD